MDAIKFLKEKHRLTEKCNIDCSRCRLSFDNNGLNLTCRVLEREHPEKMVEIVEKWSEEKSPITNLDKFEEIEDIAIKFFNCKKSDLLCRPDNIVPKLLCNKFYFCKECKEFWSTEYKEEK